jgi:hypothetical protein
MRDASRQRRNTLRAALGRLFRVLNAVATAAQIHAARSSGRSSPIASMIVPPTSAPTTWIFAVHHTRPRSV